MCLLRGIALQTTAATRNCRRALIRLRHRQVATCIMARNAAKGKARWRAVKKETRRREGELKKGVINVAKKKKKTREVGKRGRRKKKKKKKKKKTLSTKPGDNDISEKVYGRRMLINL